MSAKEPEPVRAPAGYQFCFLREVYEPTPAHQPNWRTPSYDFELDLTPEGPIRRWWVFHTPRMPLWWYEWVKPALKGVFYLVLAAALAWGAYLLLQAGASFLDDHNSGPNAPWCGEEPCYDPEPGGDPFGP